MMSYTGRYTKLSPAERKVLEDNERRRKKIEAGETRQDPKKNEWAKKRRRHW